MSIVNFEVKKLHEIDTKTLHDVFMVRSEVFVVEQGCAYQDIDGKDPKGIHIIGKKNEEIIAYSRIINLNNDFCSIGRVLVKKESRKKGLE